MSSLPKYLGLAFTDKENVKEILRDLIELVSGEKPNVFENIELGKTKSYFLSSIENTDNEELFDYIEDMGAEVFTCQFDIDDPNAEFINKQPFTYQEKVTNEEKIEVGSQTNNLVLDTLKLELETDIFKFVDDAQNNDYYDEFSQEQSAISMNYARLGKDILAYQADNLLDLVSKVDKALEGDTNYQKLQEQEAGLATLKENNKLVLDDLEQSYQEKLAELSVKMVQATINENKKELLIVQEEIKETNNHLEEQKGNLIERQKAIIKGNLVEIDNTKKELRNKIIGLADSFTTYDFKALYNYEQRFIDSRDMVVNSFNVNKKQERQRLEQAEKEKVRLLEQEEQQRKEEERIRLEEEQRQKEEQERLDRELKDIADRENSDSQNTVNNINKTHNNSPEGMSLKEKLMNISATGNTQEIPIETQNEEVPLDTGTSSPIETILDNGTEISNQFENNDIDNIYKDDTIQWSTKGSDETEYYANLENAKKEDRLAVEKGTGIAEKNKKPDKEKTSDNKIVAYAKEHKVMVISIIVGILFLGYLSTSIAGSQSKSTIEKPKTTQTKNSKTKSSSNNQSDNSNKKELSSTLYKENVKILADSNLGMYLDDNDNLTGTMRVKDKKGNVSLRYIEEYTKYGELVVTDKDGKKTVYEKAWVDNFISLIVNK